MRGEDGYRAVRSTLLQQYGAAGETVVRGGAGQNVFLYAEPLDGEPRDWTCCGQGCSLGRYSRLDLRRRRHCYGRFRGNGFRRNGEALFKDLFEPISGTMPAY